MNEWKTLSRRTVLDRGRFLLVEEHAVGLPDGRVIEHWPWVGMPDFVIAAAVTQGGDFLILRQTKYGVAGVSLAPAGGYLEPGEEPLAGARRELMEETGYEAPEWADLGSYVVDGNRGCGTAHLFLARGARRVAEPRADDLEEQELIVLGRAEVRAALLAGKFRTLPWAAAVALALLRTAA